MCNLLLLEDEPYTFITMRKFLNPFTDVGFKKLFGQEVNKELLIEFLNDLLVGERHVSDISFMDKEIMPESLGGRVVIYVGRPTVRGL